MSNGRRNPLPHLGLVAVAVFAVVFGGGILLEVLHPAWVGWLATLALGVAVGLTGNLCARHRARRRRPVIRGIDGGSR